MAAFFIHPHVTAGLLGFPRRLVGAVPTLLLVVLLDALVRIASKLLLFGHARGHLYMRQFEVEHDVHLVLHRHYHFRKHDRLIVRIINTTWKRCVNGAVEGINVIRPRLIVRVKEAPAMAAEMSNIVK